jgi:hypothetical protein
MTTNFRPNLKHENGNLIFLPSRQRCYLPNPLQKIHIFFKQTEAERMTPFAYSILNHSSLGLLEALLSVIFRPHNSYCIYVDAKASDRHKVSGKGMATIDLGHGNN